MFPVSKVYSVYQLFVEANGIKQIFYVGQTSNAKKRMDSHRFDRTHAYRNHDKMLASLARSTGVIKTRRDIQMDILSTHETSRQARDAEVIAIKAALHEPYLINVRMGARPSDFEIARYKAFTKRTIPRTPQPVVATSIDGKSGFVFKSITEAAKTLKLEKRNICNALKGIYKTCGGYVWTKTTTQTGEAA